MKKHWYLKRKNEQFFKLAKSNNLRSRSWYKISEINNKYKIFKCNSNVLEIGSFPGGWSQYIMSKIYKGKLICFDKQNLLPITNLVFFQGDLNDNNIANKISAILKLQKLDVIVSDICHKLSGISLIDINYHIQLINKLFHLCKLFLLHNGSFVVKIFNYEEYNKYIINIKKNFKNLFKFKPKSSLASSKELYIIAKNYIY